MVWNHRLVPVRTCNVEAVLDLRALHSHSCSECKRRNCLLVKDICMHIKGDLRPPPATLLERRNSHRARPTSDLKRQQTRVVSALQQI
eukprot:scaffold11162_cov113-Isochrysis_galbana.AAC.3